MSKIYLEQELTPEEKWERATIANNFIFYKVMHSNPDVCKEFLQRLLGIEIDSIVMAQEEEVFGDYDSKRIRMDVDNLKSGEVYSNIKTYYQSASNHAAPLASVA